jgi:hypothetical protein
VGSSEGVGAKPHRRSGIGWAMAVLNQVAGAGVLDRLRLRKPMERAVFSSTKAGFRTLGAATRTFTAASKLTRPHGCRRPATPACST